MQIERVREGQLPPNPNLLVTIITVVFNGANYIEQTIKSVLSQRYGNIEYIVIDGGSTDHTIDIIKKYDYAIDYWISEPDRGIAHAMNKGIEASTGDCLLFLHADDYLLHESVVQTAVSWMGEECDIAAFNIILKSAGRKIERRPRNFNYWLNFKTSLHHQGVFCSRTLLEKLGGFDESYKVAMDYEIWLRAYRKGVMPNIFNYPLTCMRDTGISSRSDWPSLKQRFLEEQRIHYQHAPGFGMRIIYKVYWMLYLPYRYIKSLPSR